MVVGTTQNKTVPVATVGGEEGGRAAMVVEDAAEPVASEASTTVPSGIVAEPGRDVFAKDERERKSVARVGEQQGPPGVDAERVVSVVAQNVGGAEAPVVMDVDEGAAGEKPEGPLGHEEALADQVAHELYPEARDNLPEGDLAE